MGEPVRVSAVIPAAGQGRRMRRGPGGQRGKVWLLLGGVPVLARTLQAFEAAPLVDEVVLVGEAGELPELEAAVSRWGLGKVRRVLAGGRERQESVYRGLAGTDPRTELVVVHDGARPLVSPELIAATLQAARERGAASAGVPAKDTIKQVDGEGRVTATLPRGALWQTQTPQAFQAGLLREAHERARAAGATATDDAALVEALGHRVQMVPGTYTNLKITTPEDLAVAEALLGGSAHGGSPPAPRVGYGYDVHPLVSDRRLVLGGVEVPAEMGLAGHSDADVLLHAITDAVLGAAGEGDIGRHFPDTDPQYAGADSRAFLRAAGGLASDRGLQVGNVDATVVAEAPRLAPYIPRMQASVAAALQVDPALVNIKATTSEGLGFVGAGQGIAAHAVVTLVPAAPGVGAGTPADRPK